MTWLDAHSFAIEHGYDSYRQVSNHARAYMHGHTAAAPILRRKGRGVWTYATDASATWRGRHLRQIEKQTDLDRQDLADLLDYTGPQRISAAMARDRWISRPYQSAIKQVFETHDLTPTDDPQARAWYAICDDVLGNLVVTKLRATKSGAQDLLGSPHCQQVIVRGHGPSPEVGRKVERGTVVCRQ
jgi:hypothetical protein